MRIALRSQQIIAHESGAANTIDPLGGSYYIEAMTDRIEEEAMGIIEEVDRMGGMVSAIERGWPQKVIHDSAYRYQRAMEAGDTVVVGVNAYDMEEEPFQEILRVDATVRECQLDRLEALRDRRDGSAVRRALEAVGEAAASDVLTCCPPSWRRWRPG